MLHPRDVAGAHDGGADRIFVVDDLAAGGLSAEPSLVSAVCKETDIPVRAMLRLNDTFTTTGGELTRLVGLGEDYLAVGAEGVSFGFLTPDLTVDVEVCRHLAEALGVPWTFHRAIDASLETSLAWRQLRGMPGLDAVLSAGSSRGMETGHEELTDRAVARRRRRRPADGRRWPARRARAVAGPGRRAPVPRRLDGPSGRVVEGARGRGPRPVVADAPRRRLGPSSRTADRVTP